MKRILFALLITFGLSVSLHAQSACTHGTDITPISADPAVLKPYIAGTAVDGDIICLAAGGPYTYTSSTQVDLSQNGMSNIVVRGAGTMPGKGSAGLTKIYVASGAPFYGTMSPGSSNHSGVENIQFTQDGSSSGAYFVAIVGNNGHTGLAWIVHHNDFLWTGTCIGLGVSSGVHKAVIYRNVFRVEITNVGGCNYTNTNVLPIFEAITDDGSFWQSASTKGNADTGSNSNIYIETNDFYGFNNASDFQGASRAVWRFNQMYNSAPGNHGYDSGPGMRHLEVYNNSFHCGDYLNHANELSGYLNMRGGTGMVFSNTFDAFNPTYCSTNNMSSMKPAIDFDQYSAYICTGGNAIPGAYNSPTTGNYPLPRQTGWGWISGSYQIVGATAGNGGAAGLNEFGNPGLNGYPTNGFQQSLEPWYIFNNANSAYQELSVRSGYVGECRAMAWSKATKANQATTVVGPPSANAGYAIPYANVGQELLAVFSDRIGGTTPTIASSPSCSWSALSGGTNGALRLSAWHCTVTTGGPQTVTVTHDSGTSARAFTVVTIRGLTASPVDAHPAVHNDTAATTFTGTTTGTLSTSTQLVCGYYALNGPLGDTVAGGATWDPALTYAPAHNLAIDPTLTGFNGTTGGSDAYVAVVCKAVDSNAALQPVLTDGTSRDGISGTVSFKVNGNTTPGTPSPLDNQVTDYVQSDREYYIEAAMFDGTSGTGTGPRTSRPSSTTNGVAWWDTDHGGNWDSTNVSANDGCLDIVVSGAWSNCVYTPADYPNPFATVTGTTCVTPDHLAWIGQPSDAIVGATLGTLSVQVQDVSNNPCTDDNSTSITLSKDGSATWNALVSGSSLTKTVTSGLATWTDTSVTPTTGSGKIQAAASGLAGAGSVDITISDPVIGTGGGIGGRLRLNIR